MGGPHGQRIVLMTGGIDFFQQLFQPPERQALSIEIIAGGGQGHQPAHFQLRQSVTEFEQLYETAGVDAGFAGLVADIDLDADIQEWQVVGTGVIQATRYFSPVYGVYPLEMRGNRLGFVGLYRPDKMPDQARIVNQVNLFDCFLDVIFAEIILAVSGGRDYVSGGPGFADGQQPRRTRLPAVFAFGRAYSLFQQFKGFCDIFHGLK